MGNKILLENQQWTIEDFEYSLHVGRTTMVTLLQDLKRILRPYSLELQYNNKNNIEIRGSELEKRRFLVQFLLKTEHFGQFLDYMKDEFLPAEMLDFKIDLTLLEGLYLHFTSLLNRLSLNVTLVNPLLEEIEAEYSEELEKIKHGFGKISYFSNLRIDDNEWAYIALHILAAIERTRQQQKSKILVICSTGIGSSQMLKSRLLKEFSDKIEIVDVISYYQLTNTSLDGIDFVLSTINLQSQFFSVPVLKVSVLLSNQDKSNIVRLIGAKKVKETEKRIAVHNLHRSEEILNQYLLTSSYVELQGQWTKEAVLEELILHLTEANSDEFITDFSRQLIVREKIGTVAFSDMIAIPHPAKPIAVSSQVIVAIVPEGIYWDEDHQDIRIVILLSPSKFENEHFSLLTELFASLLDKQTLLQEFFEEPSLIRLKEIILS